MIRLAWVVCLSWLLTACSSLNPFAGMFAEEDTGDQPAPLQALDNPRPVDMLWSAGVGDGTDGRRLNLTIAVAEDRIFAADEDGDVFALDLAGGSRLWRVDTDERIAGGPGYGDGQVYVGTSEGEVLSLSAEDGEQLWRSTVSSEVLAVPKYDRGVVVVHTVDGKLFGLNAATGERLWVHERTVPALSLRGLSSPVIDGGIVLGGFASGKLVALGVGDGRSLWDTSISTPTGRSELERLVDVDSEPVVRNGVIYVASFQGRVAAIGQDTGVVLWRRDISSYAGLDVDDTQLYITDAQSNVWALDVTSGTGLWKQDKLFARSLTAPVVHGDYVVVGDFEGYLHWLHREDGRLAARIRVKDAPIAMVPQVRDDNLYVFSDSGVVAALRLAER